ncbi:MAG: electron transport complex subunit E [Clostridia bacterium]|nr:electron transport complex subunit E [Clostridia bacterium]
MKYRDIFKNGIISENPTFVQLLGMCPTLAVTTSVSNSIGMGLSATFVLMCSNFVISLVRKVIPNKIRIAAYIVIIATFVSVVEMLLKAYLPALSVSLGMFIPLIVVNCIILARAESFAAKNSPIPSALDGISMGLGFTGALTIIGSVRELLGNGTWLGISVFGAGYNPALIFILPPGAFLVLGILIAVINMITDKKGAKEENK